MIVSIQNGLVDTSQFSELLGNQRLLVASVFDGFRIDGDRLLTTNTGRGWKVEDSPEGRHVAWLFSDAAIPCVSEPNLDRARTEKSIVNCCLNALSAIYNKTFVQLFSDPVLSKRIERLFHECYDVLSTEHPLDDREVLKKRLFDDWRYAEHYSSTWQDVTEEKETEIDFLNGYIIRLGRKYGLSTLENEKIIEELQAISSLHLHS